MGFANSRTKTVAARSTKLVTTRVVVKVKPPCCQLRDQQSGMVMQQPMGGGRVPPGCPPGGNVKLVKYWGQTAWIICIIGNFCFGFPTCFFQPCCFCDKAEYYVLGEEYYTLSGAKASKPCCADPCCADPAA